jgi:hypothetical protein
MWTLGSALAWDESTVSAHPQQLTPPQSARAQRRLDPRSAHASQVAAPLSARGRQIDPSLFVRAQRVADVFGQRLAHLIATLTTPRPPAPGESAWRSAYLRHWCQIERVWLGGGLTAALGERFVASARRELERLGASCRLEAAPNASVLALVGAARSLRSAPLAEAGPMHPGAASSAALAPKGPRGDDTDAPRGPHGGDTDAPRRPRGAGTFAPVFDFGHSAVKRGIATLVDGHLARLQVLSPRPAPPLASAPAADVLIDFLVETIVETLLHALSAWQDLASGPSSTGSCTRPAADRPSAAAGRVAADDAPGHALFPDRIPVSIAAYVRNGRPDNSHGLYTPLSGVDPVVLAHTLARYAAQRGLIQPGAPSDTSPNSRPRRATPPAKDVDPDRQTGTPPFWRGDLRIAFIHDGTAAARAMTAAGSGDHWSRTAVIQLGTALGIGFPPPPGTVLPLASDLRVETNS